MVARMYIKYLECPSSTYSYEKVPQTIYINLVEGCYLAWIVYHWRLVMKTKIRFVVETWLSSSGMSFTSDNTPSTYDIGTIVLV